MIGVKEENHALNCWQPACRITGKICVCFGGKIIPAQRQGPRLDVKATALRMDAQHSRRRGSTFSLQTKGLLHCQDTIVER